MLINPGPVRTALIDIDRATEFVGDDVDQFSMLVDLGGFFENAQVWLPTLSSEGVASIYAQRDAAVATVPVQVQTLDDNATGHFAKATTSGAGGIVITFNNVNTQYLRVKVAANQSADRSIIVRGC